MGADTRTTERNWGGRDTEEMFSRVKISKRSWVRIQSMKRKRWRDENSSKVLSLCDKKDDEWSSTMETERYVICWGERAAGVTRGNSRVLT